MSAQPSHRRWEWDRLPAATPEPSSALAAGHPSDLASPRRCSDGESWQRGALQETRIVKRAHTPQMYLPRRLEGGVRLR